MSMIGTKAIEAAEALADKILNERAEKIAKLEHDIEADSAAIDEAAKNLDAAVVSGDANSYMAAKEKHRFALDVKEMHQAHLHKLEKEPLITDEDYEKLVADIFAEAHDNDERVKKELAELAEKMYTPGCDLADAIDRANATLRRLQHDVYHDADRRKGKNGELLSSNDVKRIEDRGTIVWSKMAITSWKYEEYTGHKEPNHKEEAPKIWTEKKVTKEVSANQTACEC